MDVSITAFTARGLVRERNEDVVGADGWISEEIMYVPKVLRPKADAPVLSMVADGMGGHGGGDIAAAIAVRVLTRRAGLMTTERTVGEALAAADAAIFARIAQDGSLHKMGATVVGAVVADSSLIWFNIGDSRIYRLHGGFLRQLSIDDVPPGFTSAPDSPRSSHVVTASLGGRAETAALSPHIGTLSLASPMRLLMCSDGLTDMVGRSEIEQALAGSDLEAMLELYDKAMRAGGRDNISIIIISTKNA